LRATAYSTEGIIEAYEHESLPIMGTQFHPERLTGEDYDGRTPDFAPYFKHFVSLTQK
jgi:anthranilate/para-aminobenzoate synthase component II